MNREFIDFIEDISAVQARFHIRRIKTIRSLFPAFGMDYVIDQPFSAC